MAKNKNCCPLRLHSTLMALLLVLSINGCGFFGTMHAYPGRHKNSDDVALIKSSGTFKAVDIWSVEGYLVKGKAANVKVLPGKHTIHLEYYDVSKGLFHSVDGYVTFNAKAGKTYIAKGEEEGERVYIWIEEEDTGSLVGGNRP